jgi:ABC-type antimicrobial peptide transport system permease subunit
MSSKVEPFALQFDPERNTGVAIKIEATDISKTLAGIEHAWKTTYPNYLCRYEFMDKILERQYGTFKTIFSFLGFASALAIFIGCLGLYGLVSFMAVQRTKEIGIRKVLGATVSNIMTMFTKESVVLVAIAFVIAAPLAYFIGIALMMELPERVSPGIELFLLTLLISVVIAWVAVGYRSFSAARQNPVTSLRNE